MSKIRLRPEYDDNGRKIFVISEYEDDENEIQLPKEFIEDLDAIISNYRRNKYHMGIEVVPIAKMAQDLNNKIEKLLDRYITKDQDEEDVYREYLDSIFGPDALYKE